MKYFDISDKDYGKTYHPNLQVARKPNDVVQYVLKEDDSPLTNITPEEMINYGKTR